MSSSTVSDGFSHLLELGLITGDQHDAIRTYGRPILIKPDSSPAEHLVWMVENRLIAHDGLIEVTGDPSCAAEGGLSSEQKSVLEKALTELDRRAEALNAKLLDELLSAGLISTIDRDLTLNQGCRYFLGTPATTLAYVVVCGVMTRERFAALQGQGHAEIVEEADLTIRALDLMRESEHAASKRPGWHVAAEVFIWILVALQAYHAIF